MSPVRRVKQTNSVVAGLESIILILWQQTKPCKRNFVYTIITSIYQQSYFNADFIRPFNSESETCYICQIIANGQKIFKEYLHVDYIVIILRYLMIIFMLPNISLKKVLEYLIPYFIYVLSGPYYMFASYPRGNTIYLFYCYIDLNLSSLQCLIYLEAKNQLEEKIFN